MWVQPLAVVGNRLLEGRLSSTLKRRCVSFLTFSSEQSGEPELEAPPGGGLSIGMIKVPVTALEGELYIDRIACPIGWK